MREANLGIHGQLQEKCENVKDCDNLDLGKLGDNAETQFLAIAAALVSCLLTFTSLQHLSFLKLAHPNPISTKSQQISFCLDKGNFFAKRGMFHFAHCICIKLSANGDAV